MQQQTMNLNIRYDAPDEVWHKVPLIYRQLDGWLDSDKNGNPIENSIPYWFSFDRNLKHVSASVEPGGLLFEGFMDDDEWAEWAAEIKRIATNVLGYKVGEIETGEVDF